MRKRSVVLGACIFAAFSLTGCKDTETLKGNPTFNATVLEIGENTILVEPFENEEISTGEILVTTDVISKIEVTELEEGTEVCIVYNGEILETYPARIKTVFAIYLLDENGEAIIEKDSD